MIKTSEMSEFLNRIDKVYPESGIAFEAGKDNPDIELIEKLLRQRVQNACNFEEKFLAEDFLYKLVRLKAELEMLKREIKKNPHILFFRHLEK